MLLNYLRIYLEQEKEKLTGMTGSQAAQYIWQYYKLWIIGLICLIWFAGFMLYTTFFVPKENWLYVVFGNVPATAAVQEGSTVHSQLAAYAGYDLTKKNLVLDTDCYCHPFEEPYNNHYYDKLIALLDGGVADGVVMEEQDLLALGRSGRLLDLQGEKFTVGEQWQDRLVFLDNPGSDYEKDRIPVAIDLTGSTLTESGLYPEGCAIALSSLAPHPEELEVFLTFLFGEEQTWVF